MIFQSYVKLPEDKSENTDSGVSGSVIIPVYIWNSKHGWPLLLYRFIDGTSVDDPCYSTHGFFNQLLVKHYTQITCQKKLKPPAISPSSIIIHHPHPSTFSECVARVPVSLWGSGGWGCVRSTLRLRPQPFATVRNRPHEDHIVLQKGLLLEVSNVDRVASFRVADVALPKSSG